MKWISFLGSDFANHLTLIQAVSSNLLVKRILSLPSVIRFLYNDFTIDSLTTSKNRNAEAARYKRSSSNANHLLLKDSETAPVVLEPANTSRTISPGSVRNLIKNSGIFSGNLAGCPPIPTILQHLRYCELLSVLGIWRRFGGIAPPLSSAKRPLISWPEGRFLGE